MELPESNAAAIANEPVAPRTPRLRAWTLALTAGLAAGGVGWLIGEASHDRLQPPILATGGVPTLEEAQAGARAARSAVALQAAVAFGGLGAALGLALGLAGGGARRSARSAVIGGGLGAVVGGAAGAVAPFALLPIYFQFYNPDRDDLTLAVLIQGAIGAAVGGAGGAAFGLGARARVTPSLLGGLLGAVVGVLVYQIVGATAFPLDQTTKPVAATAGARFLGQFAAAVLASAGAAAGYTSNRPGMNAQTPVQSSTVSP